jgi:hypothetical protein
VFWVRHYSFIYIRLGRMKLTMSLQIPIMVKQQSFFSRVVPSISTSMRTKGLFTSRGKGPEPKEMQRYDWWKHVVPHFWVYTKE